MTGNELKGALAIINATPRAERKAKPVTKPVTLNGGESTYQRYVTTCCGAEIKREDTECPACYGRAFTVLA